MVATSQRFYEETGVRIVWDVRSLHDFGSHPIGVLADSYDLLVVDHPLIGDAVASGSLAVMDEIVAPNLLATLSREAVGASYESYRWAGYQMALPIDAAAPVASFRPDLMVQLAVPLPKTWGQMIEAMAAGYIIFPNGPLDLLMLLYALCTSMEQGPFVDGHWRSSDAVVGEALMMVRDLVKRAVPETLGWNPINVYEAMATGDRFAYCPLAYGYSNYAREGFAPKRLQFCEPIRLDGNRPLVPTLGGAGLAISARSVHARIAAEYASLVAGEVWQRTLFGETGGQPAHRAAWLDNEMNRRTNGFFQATLETHDRAYLRPRNAGYVAFQDRASLIVHEFAHSAGSSAAYEASRLRNLAAAIESHRQGVHKDRN